MGKLTLYDILSDAFPGAVAVILFSIFALPEELITEISGNLLAGGLIFTVSSYTLGRILRNTEKIYYDEVIRLIKNQKESNSTEIDLLETSEYSQVKFEDRLYDIVCEESEVYEIEEIRDKFKEKVETEFEIGNTCWEDLSKKRFQQSIITPGYNRIWGENTLYRRYTIISNFYEALTKILLVIITIHLSVSCLFFTDVIYRTILISEMTDDFQLIFVIITFLIFSFWVLFAKQHKKFEKKRAIAFMIEINSI